MKVKQEVSKSHFFVFLLLGVLRKQQARPGQAWNSQGGGGGELQGSTQGDGQSYVQGVLALDWNSREAAGQD